MCDYACFRDAPPKSAIELLEEAERRRKKREEEKRVLEQKKEEFRSDEFIQGYIR